MTSLSRWKLSDSLASTCPARRHWPRFNWVEERTGHCQTSTSCSGDARLPWNSNQATPTPPLTWSGKKYWLSNAWLSFESRKTFNFHGYRLWKGCSLTWLNSIWGQYSLWWQTRPWWLLLRRWPHQAIPNALPPSRHGQKLQGRHHNHRRFLRHGISSALLRVETYGSFCKTS